MMDSFRSMDNSEHNRNIEDHPDGKNTHKYHGDDEDNDNHSENNDENDANDDDDDDDDEIESISSTCTWALNYKLPARYMYPRNKSCSGSNS